jgi:hypothetical protein
MPNRSPWIAYYESLPGGQFRIMDENLIALQAAHPSRLLFAEIGGKTEHVLLLDFPFRVAEKFISFNAYYLRRIAVMDLPGWLSSLSGVSARSPMRHYKLKSARFIPGGAHGHDGVELVLEHQAETFKIWHTGCPIPLLKCEVATLNQEGALGKKLVDLQNMRLIAAD